MDIQFFQTFLTVAKLCNMTQAAEQLNFTQPTITGQIRALEQHFGIRLFDRIGKKLFITDAGRELIVYAEKLLSIYEEAHTVLSTHPGNIKLGIAVAMVNYILVPFLQKFQQQVTNCSITMEMCIHSSAVVKGIAENRFDLGFIQNGVPADFLIGFEIFKEQLVWVVHPKLAEKYNDSTNILDYPLLAYRTGGLFRPLCEEALGRKQDVSTIEYSDSEAMKNAILQSLGCGALPHIMIKQLLEVGALVEFSNIPRPAFSIWVVSHKDKLLTQEAMSLIKILQEG
jgi:DNA-binding transcriptional LysR family regulator